MTTSRAVLESEALPSLFAGRKSVALANEWPLGGKTQPYPAFAYFFT